LLRREPSGCLLREGQPAIDGDLKNPAAAFAQADIGGGLGLQDQVPRRDRSRLVASHAAEFDLYVHIYLTIFCNIHAEGAWQR
jgi:hypothetical protein